MAWEFDAVWLTNGDPGVHVVGLESLKCLSRHSDEFSENDSQSTSGCSSTHTVYSIKNKDLKYRYIEIFK